MLVHLFINSIHVLLILANIPGYNKQLKAKFTIKDSDCKSTFQILSCSFIKICFTVTLVSLLAS